jgi:opacity protein-like surface antigen
MNSFSKLFIITILTFFMGNTVAAQESASSAPPPPSSASDRSDEDDFVDAPYNNYGSFNEEEDEAEDLRFFQLGRFFGLSVGLGYQSALGNKGILYQGGFPAFQFKMHHWFDFHLALGMSVYSASQYFYERRTGDSDVKRYDFSLLKIGLDLKYYLNVENMNSIVHFANPYFIVGFANYRRNLKSEDALEDPEDESKMGYHLGAGFEFPFKPKKTYLNIETNLHFVSFSDEGSPATVRTSPLQSLDDRSGPFFSLLFGILFTW